MLGESKRAEPPARDFARNETRGERLGLFYSALAFTILPNSFSDLARSGLTALGADTPVPSSLRLTTEPLCRSSQRDRTAHSEQGRRRLQAMQSRSLP